MINLRGVSVKKVFSELAAYAINEQFNAGLRIEVEMKENIDEECCQKTSLSDCTELF